jgi:malonate transporter
VRASSFRPGLPVSSTQKILEILFPMGLGLLLRLVGLFGDREGELLRKFVVRLGVPVLCFFSLYAAKPESVAAIAPMAGAFVLMCLTMWSVGWLAATRFKEPSQRSAVHACVTFGNYGWMGLGVMTALLGVAGTQRVVYFFLLWWPLFYGLGLPIGIIHVGRRTGGVPLGKTLAVAAPPILCAALGLAANLASVHVPDLLTRTLSPFGEMTVPLILLSVGMMLDPSRLHTALRPALLVTALTLLIGPLVGWGIAALLAPDPVSYRTIIMEGAMPVATLVPLLEENYAMDKDLVSTAIVLSTLVSLATIPVVAALVIP